MITFDPLEFSRMAPKKQAEVIKGIAKFEVDLDQLDALNKADYDLRRDLNRDIKELDAQISGIKIPEGTPEAAVDIFKKTTDYNTALDKNREIVSLQGKVRVTEEGITNLEGQVKTLQDRIKQGQDILEDYKNKLAEAEKQFSDEQKIEALKTEIAQAETLNRGVALREQKDGKKKDLKAKEDQVETLNKAMAAREKQKAETIAKAKLPIEGLSLTDGAVTFNGLPLEQCSSAEQLRISTAIAIASNPELRVLRIKDGALLDSDSLAILEKMAIEHDFQMWIERVGEEPLSVVIEEGRVKKSGA
jgi:predicted HicB family RNase H-like nuclease